MEDDAKQILEKLKYAKPRSDYFVPEVLTAWKNDLVVYAVTKTFTIHPTTCRVGVDGHNMSPFLIGVSVETDCPYPCGYELNVCYASVVGGWGKEFHGPMIPKLHAGEMTLLGTWPMAEEDPIELVDPLAKEIQPQTKKDGKSTLLTVQSYRPGSFDLRLFYPCTETPSPTGTFTFYGLALIDPKTKTLRIPKTN